MIFDPAYSVPTKAMHEAFVVEFLIHTVSHIMDEIDQGGTDLLRTNVQGNPLGTNFS